MPPPGLSIGVGSDDEDNEIDVSDAGAPPSLALNTTMAGMVLPAGLALGPDSDDDSAESTSEIKQKLPAPDANAYELSKTGAFKLADFQLRPEGGLTVVGGSSSPGQPAHPEDMSPSTGAGVPRINVSSLKELDGRVGSSASGTVVKGSPPLEWHSRRRQMRQNPREGEARPDRRRAPHHDDHQRRLRLAPSPCLAFTRTLSFTRKYAGRWLLEGLVKQHAGGQRHDELELLPSGHSVRATTC